MSELVVVDAPSPLSIEEMASRANAEADEAAHSIAEAVEHAIKAGEWLLLIRTTFANRFRDDGKRNEGSDGWIAWLEDNFRAGPQMAQRFVRLAAYKNHLPKEAFEPYVGRDNSLRYPNPTRAISYLRSLPPVFPSGRAPVPESLKKEMRRLRKSGLTYREISERTGYSIPGIGYICNPEKSRAAQRRFQEKRRQSRAANRALLEKQRRDARTAAAASRGGNIGKAYTLIVKDLTKALDAALLETEVGEERALIAQALGFVYKAEDSVGRALRVL